MKENIHMNKLYRYRQLTSFLFNKTNVTVFLFLTIVPILAEETHLNLKKTQTDLNCKNRILSDFWNDQSELLDSVEIVAPNNTTQIVLKATYSTDGIFFCCIISDDCWYDNPADLTGINRWKYDVFSINIDTLSKESMRENVEKDIWYYSSGSISKSTFSISNWMAKGINDTGSYISLYSNRNFINEEGVFNEIAYEKIPEQFEGLLIDPIEINDNQRALEIFIPWKILGRNLLKNIGGISDPISEGRKLAFNFSYVDFDCDYDSSTTLSWLNNKLFGGNAETRLTSIDSWGEIVLSEDLVLPIKQKKLCPFFVKKNSAPQTFDLKGRLLKVKGKGAVKIIDKTPFLVISR